MKWFDKFKYKYPWQKYYKKDERDITVPDMSIYEYFRMQSEDNMDSIAINYFNKKMTFKELLKEIDTCARALKSQGVRAGDVVTIMMPNTPEAVISFYAVSKIGALANMIHPLSAEEEIKFSLESTHSVLLITVDLSYSKIKNIIEDTDVYKIIVSSPADSMPTLLSLGYLVTKGMKIEKPAMNEKYVSFKNFMERGKDYKEKVLVKKGKDDAALILHSGGTTGTPKNIVLTNGNIDCVIEQAKIIFPNLGVGDSFLSILPMFHCFGLLVCVHAPLCMGATAILVPQFDANRFDKLLKKYHPTVIPGVPTLFEALLKNPFMDNVDLSNVKYVISGGDSLNEEKNKKVNEFLKAHKCKVTIMQGYGMTESSGPTAIGSFGSNKHGSVGIPLPGNVIEITEPTTGIAVAPGEIGEICITGPNVMQGYLDNEEETNNIIRIHEDGKRWVHTGDLGYMDEDGVIFFVQRLKRMLIVSGYNVYPSHIEDILCKHPAVKTCGVIGVPHPYKVQVPKAFIVLNDGYEESASLKAEIKEYCKKNLAAYMVPKDYEFRKSLPTTLIGKVDYKNI